MVPRITTRCLFFLETWAFCFGIASTVTEDRTCSTVFWGCTFRKGWRQCGRRSKRGRFLHEGEPWEQEGWSLWVRTWKLSQALIANLMMSVAGASLHGKEFSVCLFCSQSRFCDKRQNTSMYSTFPVAAITSQQDRGLALKYEFCTLATEVT